MDDYDFKIEAYREGFRDQLIGVWERSVLATHHFLSPTDFEEIKELVKSIDFNQLDVFCLTGEDRVLGFVGVLDRKVEMLFLDPDFFGQGLGKKLLMFALTQLGAGKVDVNEQNSKAVEFYRRSGFQTFERTDTDDQGRNYPLLRMKLADRSG
ncbi:GNAT family N-acetyltransferase [Algoriphagus sp. A40]|uniref:GNAT family N-acetyltransferase n=1 Tax=Algoriphagus sp. A40 TaxID=1945863 RepID=UPI000985CEAD|nr:GNAT family N-acetyltransferase [Algoriphagus sp. A40]OOG77892.1 GNAT family N-acetyltransferase [Algoriphagus sp. A40]